MTEMTGYCLGDKLLLKIRKRLVQGFTAETTLFISILDINLGYKTVLINFSGAKTMPNTRPSI